LLALETAGGILLIGFAGLTNLSEFEPDATLALSGILLVIWTLPNALVFYKARGKFTVNTKAQPSALEK
jgi:hypothetical protein